MMKLYENRKNYRRITIFLLMVTLVFATTIANSYAAVSYHDENEDCSLDICFKRVHLVRALETEEPYFETSGTKRFITKYAWNWSKWRYEPQVLSDRKYAVTFYYNKTQINKNTGGDASLVIFSSGGGMDSRMYQNLLWKVASDGHIVAAIDHTFIDHQVLIPSTSSPGEFDTESSWHLQEKMKAEIKEFYNEFLDSGEMVPFDYFETKLHLTNSVFEFAAIDVKEFIEYLNDADVSTNNSDLTVNGLGSTSRNFNLKAKMNLDKIVYAGHSLGGMTATLMISGEENEFLEGRAEENPLWNPYYEDQIGAVVSFDGAALNHLKYTYGDFKLKKPYFFIGSEENWDGLGTIKGSGGRLMNETVNALFDNNYDAVLFGIVLYDTYHNGIGDEKVKNFWGRGPDYSQITLSAKYIDRIIKVVFENDSDPLWQQIVEDEEKEKIWRLNPYE